MGWTDEHPVNSFGTLQHQCLRKRGYKTRKFARKVAKDQMKQFGYRLTVYHCRICDYWHIAKD